MTKQAINIPGAPALPFSSAIRAGDFIFVSGVGGYTNPKTNERIEGIEAQTRRCIETIKEVLGTAGSSLDDVVKTTVFITDAGDFTKMNEVYRSYFSKDLPARSTIVTGLVARPMAVEIECIAYHPQ